VSSTVDIRAPIDHAPPTKPPSARPVETRKSQLIRTYTSLIRSTPLILFFQHSNLTAVEWAAVRRELKKIISAVPPPHPVPGVEPIDVASKIQLQVLRTNMLNVAFKIVELYDPESAASLAKTPRTTRGPLIHDLSEAAYEAIRNTPVPEDSSYAQIEPLMVGPIAALTLPAVSPVHVAAALSVLAPVPGKFPAPSRKKNPGYHDPTCQNALAKLVLIGGRIEGKIFDQSGVNWVGGIEGGLEGLRAQLVAILQGAGLGITNALEGNSRNLWLALEGRKGQLEEEQGGKKEGE
jgi:ribosomal protein L10